MFSENLPQRICRHCAGEFANSKKSCSQYARHSARTVLIFCRDPCLLQKHSARTFCKTAFFIRGCLSQKTLCFVVCVCVLQLLVLDSYAVDALVSACRERPTKKHVFAPKASGHHLPPCFDRCHRKYPSEPGTDPYKCIGWDMTC